MGRTGGEEPSQAGAGDRPGDGTESGQRRLRSRGMPSRTRAEGTASGPLPPAVGRGHRALGWKGAFPPHSNVLQGGAFSGDPPPPVSLARCSQNARPAGSREGTGGDKKEKSPPRGEDVCYSLDPGSPLARLGDRFWPPKRGRWWPGCSARPRTTRSVGVGVGRAPRQPLRAAPLPSAQSPPPLKPAQ